MTTRRTPWAAAGAVLVLGGCTFGSGAPTATSAPTSAMSSPSGSSTTSPSPPVSRGGGSPSTPGRGSPSPTRPVYRQLHLTTTARIPLTGQTYGRGLVFWDRYAAWMGCDGCQRTFTDPTTLYVADLATHRVRAVATAARNGFLTPVGGSGTRLVYRVDAPAAGKSRWALNTLDIADGVGTTLATGPYSDASGPPAVVVADGQVVWQTFGTGPERTSHGPVTAVDLSTGARRTVSRDLSGVLEAVTRTGLVYRAASAAGAPLDEGPTDAFLLPAGRRQPRFLSQTHDVGQVVADDTTAAWQTREGVDAAVWAGPLDGTAPPRRYYRGGSGDRAVGTGFLALVTAGDFPVLLVYPLAGGSVVAVGDVPGEFDSVAAEGPHLAYIALPGDRGVQPDAKHPIALVVSTVDLPG